jgi:hypothetical protein
LARIARARRAAGVEMLLANASFVTLEAGVREDKIKRNADVAESYGETTDTRCCVCDDAERCVKRAIDGLLLFDDAVVDLADD